MYRFRQRRISRGVLLIDGGSPYLLLIALFALTAALGQVIRTATVLIVAPVAVSAARGDRRVTATGAHADGGGRGGVLPYADRHSGQHDGHGTRRLPLR
jgi:di/tricarboxylate transporter